MSAQAPTGGPAGSGRTLGSAAGKVLRSFLTLREGSIIIVTIATFVYFLVTAEGFATGSNFKTLLPYFAPVAILAAGEVFVMINGEIDLSIGAVYLITPFLYYKLASSAGLPLVPAVILALVGSGIVGLVNGFFIAVVGISSFVATFGMLFTLSGLTLVISHSAPVTTPGTTDKPLSREERRNQEQLQRHEERRRKQSFASAYNGSPNGTAETPKPPPAG